jgi:hypothetical protein
MTLQEQENLNLAFVAAADLIGIQSGCQNIICEPYPWRTGRGKRMKSIFVAYEGNGYKIPLWWGEINQCEPAEGEPSHTPDGKLILYFGNSVIGVAVTWEKSWGVVISSNAGYDVYGDTIKCTFIKRYSAQDVAEWQMIY